MKWRLVPYNVSDGTIRSRQEQRETKVLTLEQQLLAFLKAARGDHFEALYVVAGFTGMRPGELLATRWSDLVFDGPSPVVRVCRSLSEGPDRLLFKNTKTGKGRSISLLPETVEALKAHRKRQAQERLHYSGM